VTAAGTVKAYSESGEELHDAGVTQIGIDPAFILVLSKFRC
jgi:hypothetical protein